LKRSLREEQDVTVATYAAGFGSASRVYERSSATLGMTPARYAGGARGERVRYTVAPCGLGTLLVARTARGICAVRIGQDEQELRSALAAEFPGAELSRDDADLRRGLEAIVAAIDHAGPDPRLPLDVRATAFQRRVWKALQQILRGETRTYGQIAASIHMPSAARAVARACASNPVAIVVPCHRVIRGDGARGGYRWGAERKARLLDAESR
jgi:AraC family transcriptional regulator of adaptative response/methylated-DNA-[protein]-cysteine methyltransferase